MAGLFERGCSGGDVWGCNNLGALRARGIPGVTKNEPQAAEILSRACDAGLPEACANRQVMKIDPGGLVGASLATPVLTRGRPQVRQRTTRDDGSARFKNVAPGALRRVVEARCPNTLTRIGNGCDKMRFMAYYYCEICIVTGDRRGPALF